MVRELLSSLGKYKEPAVLIVLGIAVFVWGIKELSDIAGPNALTRAVEQKITEAETRSKVYVDEKTLHGEQIVEIKHAEVMRAIKRLDRSIDKLTDAILDTNARRPRENASNQEDGCDEDLFMCN